MLFHWIFIAFIAFVLTVDHIFLDKPAWRSKWLYFSVLAGAGFVAMIPQVFEPIRQWLGVGRLVDAVLYLTTVLLVRELFISRSRYVSLERKLTQLARGVALNNAQEIQTRPNSKKI